MTKSTTKQSKPSAFEFKTMQENGNDDSHNVLPGEDSQKLVQVLHTSGVPTYNSNSLRDVGHRIIDDIAYSLRHIGLSSLRGSTNLGQSYFNTTFRPRNNKVGESPLHEPSSQHEHSTKHPRKNPQVLESGGQQLDPSPASVSLCLSCSLELAEKKKGICMSCQANTRNRRESFDNRQNLRFNKSLRPAAYRRAGLALNVTSLVSP